MFAIANFCTHLCLNYVDLPIKSSVFNVTLLMWNKGTYYSLSTRKIAIIQNGISL